MPRLSTAWTIIGNWRGASQTTSTAERGRDRSQINSARKTRVRSPPAHAGQDVQQKDKRKVPIKARACRASVLSGTPPL